MEGRDFRSCFQDFLKIRPVSSSGNIWIIFMPDFNVLHRVMIHKVYLFTSIHTTLWWAGRNSSGFTGNTRGGCELPCVPSSWWPLLRLSDDTEIVSDRKAVSCFPEYMSTGFYFRSTKSRKTQTFTSLYPTKFHQDPDGKTREKGKNMCFLNTFWAPFGVQP